MPIKWHLALGNVLLKSNSINCVIWKDFLHELFAKIERTANTHYDKNSITYKQDKAYTWLLNE